MKNEKSYRVFRSSFRLGLTCSCEQAAKHEQLFIYYGGQLPFDQRAGLYYFAGPFSIGRPVRDHSLHEPTYSFGFVIPACSMASNV